jgi:hypothetical protein
MISWIVILSIVVYLAFAFWDRKQVKDEREKLIELKTSELQSKITLYALMALAVLYWANPEMPTWLCLLVINVANLYTEIIGKIYLRTKI